MKTYFAVCLFVAGLFYLNAQEVKPAIDFNSLSATTDKAYWSMSGLTPATQLILTLPQMPGCSGYCPHNEDWDKLYQQPTKWEFVIEGKQYNLTGAEVAALVKSLKR
jgi:hypothetical protein